MQPVPMMAAPKKGMPTWLIVVLVVVGLGVVLLGTMGALAIFGVRKYLAAAKGAEALNSVTEMAANAEAYYSDPGRGAGHLCTSASSPVPSSIAVVAGKRYQSSPSDWEVDAPTKGGFACVGFAMTAPQYFQYDYRLVGKGTAVGDEFHAIARGDLDADGITSVYDLSGKIDSPDHLVLATAPVITNPNE
ncbi:MAG: hypothetical protein ABI551_14400 [Polyangiaceae bacterium]